MLLQLQTQRLSYALHLLSHPDIRIRQAGISQGVLVHTDKKRPRSIQTRVSGLDADKPALGKSSLEPEACRRQTLFLVRDIPFRIAQFRDAPLYFSNMRPAIPSR